jgi:hypothetical protein
MYRVICCAVTVLAIGTREVNLKTGVTVCVEVHDPA